MATTLETDPMHNDNNDRLRRHLEALPEAPLPDALWPRVAAARRRQVARRRLVLCGGVAVALALLVLPPRLGDFGLPATGDPGIANDIASTGDMPARAPVASDPDARLRILDRELQAAYRRGSDASAIAQLWEARDALLRERATAMPVRPVRI